MSDIEQIRQDHEAKIFDGAWHREKTLLNHIDSLRQQLSAYREALEFYASDGSWQNDCAEYGSTSAQVPYTAPIFSDCGSVAHQALAGDTEKE